MSTNEINATIAKPMKSNLEGTTIGRWSIIQRMPPFDGETGYTYQCRCECGTEKRIRAFQLSKGNSNSCGCLAVELSKARATHGYARKDNVQSEWRIWHGMRERCSRPNNRAFKHYGGRGIKVCERWKDFAVFLADMGLRPSNRHSIDRIDNNGNYEPSNCRWATHQQQISNRRTVRIIEISGEKRSISEWARIAGIHNSTLTDRIEKGWPIEKLLIPSIPTHKRRWP